MLFSVKFDLQYCFKSELSFEPDFRYCEFIAKVVIYTPWNEAHEIDGAANYYP